MSTFISLEVAGPIATVTLNRPEKRNAFNTDMSLELEAAIDQIEADPAIRVAILRATTTEPRPVFSAGYDLTGGAGDDHGGYTDRGGFGGITRRERTKPIIAAVDGFAVGGGFEIVLACDLVVASERSSFALAEVKWNLVAAGGGVFRLQRVIGRFAAMDMLLTASPLPAPRAHQLGLVSRLAADGELDAVALAVAGEIAGNAPVAVRLTRRAVSLAEGLDDAASWQLCEELEKDVAASEDTAEGVQAFLERRAPQWSGR